MIEYYDISCGCRPSIQITDTGSLSTIEKLCYVLEKLEEVIEVVNQITTFKSPFYLDPHDFGALGNGVADDSASLQAMITAIGVLKVTVNFTNQTDHIIDDEITTGGDYVISSDLTFPDNIEMKFLSKARFLIALDKVVTIEGEINTLYKLDEVFIGDGIYVYSGENRIDVLESLSQLVTSVNTKTGAVILNQDEILDGATYERTHNDYTDAEKTKLLGIEADADVNAVDSVNTKTGVVVLNQDEVLDGATYERTHNDYTDAEKTRLGELDDTDTVKFGVVQADRFEYVGNNNVEIAGTAYTLSQSNNGKKLFFTAVTDVTITLPLNATEAITAGFECVISKKSSGDIIIALEGGVSLMNADGYTKITTQYKGATISKTDTNEWWEVGLEE